MIVLGKGDKLKKLRQVKASLPILQQVMFSLPSVIKLESFELFLATKLVHSAFGRQSELVTV